MILKCIKLHSSLDPSNPRWNPPVIPEACKTLSLSKNTTSIQEKMMSNQFLSWMLNHFLNNTTNYKCAEATFVSLQNLWSDIECKDKLIQIFSYEQERSFSPIIFKGVESVDPLPITSYICQPKNLVFIWMQKFKALRTKMKYK